MDVDMCCVCTSRIRFLNKSVINISFQSAIPVSMTVSVSPATIYLFGNKIADKITKVSKTSPQKTIETVSSETENIGFNVEKTKKIHFTKNNNTLLISKDYYKYINKMEGHKIANLFT